MRLRQISAGVFLALFGALVLGGATAHGAHPGTNGKIAFEGWSSLERVIKTVNVDGSGLTDHSDPDWTGEWIDFQDTGLTTAWSPDGTKLAFYADPDGGGPVHPLCSEPGAIWSLTPATDELEIVHCPASPGRFTGYFPSSMSWSPDGSQIVLDDLDGGVVQSISLIDVDSGDTTPLMGPQPNGAFSPTCEYPAEYAFVGNPSWSPLGDRIAFALYSDYGCPSINGIWTAAVDGSDLEQITEGFHSMPDWSPDGSKIVFVGSQNLTPQGPLYVVDVEGGVPMLVKSGSANRTPVWSPDGTKIAFAVLGAGVYVMDADGDNVTLVPNTSDVRRAHISWQPIVSTDPDADDDGVDDAIDTGASSFDDGDGTSGQITDANGLDVFVTDAADSGDGVTITVTGSSALKASFTICGFPIKISGGSEVTISCASVIVEVIEGSAEVELAGGAVVVSVPEGGKAEVSEVGGTFYSVENLGPTDVTVSVDGEETTLSSGESTEVSTDVTGPTVTCSAAPSFLLNEPGAAVTASVEDEDGGSGEAQSPVSVPVSTSAPGSHSVQVAGEDEAGNETTASCGYQVEYAFSGFFQPVDNPPTVNSAKAGQTIPITWRIADFYGVGVSDPASFLGVTTGSIACDSQDPQDAIETYTGSSGLQYQGNGTWLFSWKTPKSYAGQCRLLRLNLADGATTRTAEFRFR